METMRISDRVTVGPQPSEEDLKELARQGFRSVVNLRKAGESDQPLSPEEEGRRAEELGLRYEHLPVSMQEAGPELVDQFRKTLPELPGPVYVHCHAGTRAGAFAMMDEAVQRGQSGEETVKQAQEMGFKCDAPEIKRFVTEYVDSRRG